MRLVLLFPAVAVLLLITTALNGCMYSQASGNSPPTNRVRLEEPVRANAPDIRHWSAYLDAKRLLTAHDYHGYLTRLDALLATPGLSGVNRDFLARQREICLAALSPKPHAAATP